MRNFFTQMMKGVLLGLYLTIPLMAANTARADDTEVYFFDGSKIDTGRPKVMLLLEFSSAMNGGGRLAKIQQALLQLANDPEVNSEVDFGLAIFAKSRSGSIKAEGTVHYPIAKLNSATELPNFSTVVTLLSLKGTVPGSTPTIEGMSEAYRYFLNRTPYYWNSSSTHPSAVSNSRYAFSDTSGCAAKALVVLAHGQINGNEWRNATQSIVGRSSTDTEMVSYMKGTHDVDTYTISPGSSGNNKQNLDNWANAGGTEKAFDWNDETDCNAVDAEGNPVGLCAILKKVIEEVSSQGTSFVQAGVTVSQQNRLNHDNHLYFAQFQADDIARWPGNLKKYKIDGGQLVDVNQKPAVDTDTGLFLEERDANGFITNSTSFWAPKDGNGNLIADGNQVERGGTLEGLDGFLKTTPQEVDGTIYQTFASYSRNLYFDSSDVLSPIATKATAADFDMPVSTEEEKQAFETVFTETLGYSLRDVTVTRDDGTEVIVENVAEPARLMGDPLHSVPKVLQYKVGDSTKSVGFMGTNLGYLHAVDLDTGVENWGYVPKEMLKKMQEFLDDVKIGGDPTLHNYGLDGEIHIAHGDSNGNILVDEGEKALLIIGMRRGGNRYYVLDISDIGSPKFLFRIQGGGIGDLSQLGDTWSPVTVTNINFGEGTKTVAIFGGGYDKDQDDATTFVKDDIGNDVFIYDIANQKVLWNLQGSALQTVKGQINSVPGAIRALSLKTNIAIAEHLYVADTGGQIFRFDLYPTETGMDVKAGRIFKARGNNSESENRRFFYAPSVAFIPQPQGKSFVAVAVGSGYRAHPLNAKIDDYFFMVKDQGVLQSTKTFNDVAFNGTNPDAEQQLLNVTDTVSSNTTTRNAIVSGEKSGWFIELNGEINTTDANGNTVTDTYAGEKVISEARILFGKVVFTSYVPTVDLTKLQCAPVIGSAKLYGVDVVDGSSFFDENTRVIDLISSGIPPVFQLLYTSGGSADTTTASFIGLVGNEVIQDDFTKALTKGYDGVIRVNWRKKPDDE
ncbi:hypothetical protein [Kangiella marina]|uniref:VWFA domain-containing protein n=1 Tax=Kangiella marina TaxID=1079178 RepID=A0ABP8IP44_9GAMM